MPQLNDLQVINGPVAPATLSNSWMPGIVYSVSLPSGIVLTNPEQFARLALETQPEPQSTSALRRPTGRNE